MTVRRQQTEFFENSPQELAAAIRVVLARGQADYAYVSTIESGDGRLFDTLIQPVFPGALPIHFKIFLYPFENRIKLKVETQSQWYLVGEITGNYRTYIRVFLESLQLAIRHELGELSFDKRAQEERFRKLHLAINVGYVLYIVTTPVTMLFILNFAGWVGLPLPEAAIDILATLQALFFLGAFGIWLRFNILWKKKYPKPLEPKGPA